jgi:hypothetical protein
VVPAVDLTLAAPELERTIFPGLPDEADPDFELRPKRLRTPLSDFLLMEDGEITPLRIRFLLAEDPERELMLVFSLVEDLDLRATGSIFAPPPPPPPPPAPSNESDLRTTVAPVLFTAVLLELFDEEPLEIVLLLPQGGETARRTVRLDPEAEEPPIVELLLEALLLLGRVKVRFKVLELEALPKRLGVV